jgi:uncharacterized protein YgbK (DUF1537 family)
MKGAYSMRIGVTADDITGSNDIGICFSQGGAKAAIYTYDKDLQIDDDADVVIIDTDSRFDSPEQSYEKVYQATKILMAWGADKLYKKTCSVFRGNIGPEFDAMQDAAGVHRSMVIVGFPKNGRTTLNGIHHVNGIPLEHTQFTNDPIHPMTQSNLVDILSGQTKRKVSLISCNEYDNWKELYAKVKANDNEYILFDIRDDNDLMHLADVLKDEMIYCGSSALGELLPKSLHMRPRLHPRPYAIDKTKGVLVLAGSLTSQTAEQIAYAQNYMKAFKLDTMSVVNEKAAEQREELIAVLTDQINAGSHAILYTANSNIEVKATKEIARQNGLDDKLAGKMISDFMADICQTVLDQTGSLRFISLGGDTSAAITRKLGLTAMYVVDEIDTGVPTLMGKPDKPYYFVLKSGSFEKADFIMRAIEKLS